jgi:hypothetical protein
MALTAKPGAVGLAVLTAHPVSAATVTVDCAAGVGDVADLQTKIGTANSTPGTILSLGANCTYTITNANKDSAAGEGLKPISGAMTIEGNGATIVRDGAAADFRIFHVNSSGDLTLQHLTVSNGVSSGSPAFGGGIYNQGGKLTVVSSTISGNKATKTGTGGITAKGGGILTTGTTSITDSTITGNIASIVASGTGSSRASGGGIAAKGGSLKVRNTTISENSATASAADTSTVSASGGGIAVHGAPPSIQGGTMSATIIGSTVSANTATGTSSGRGASASASGAAIDQDNTNPLSNFVVKTTVINTTVANNTVSNGSTADNTGAGINAHFDGGNDKLTLINDTVAGNSGGVKRTASDNGSAATATLTNTILAGNLDKNCNGTIVDGGQNISFPAGDTTCANTFSQGDPILGALLDNGGLTKTMALGTGSAAIDTGGNSACLAADPPAVPAGAAGIDQRGLPRNEVAGDTMCDIGAFEVQPVAATPSPAASIAPVKLPKSGLPRAEDPSGGALPWALIVPSAAVGGALLLGRRRRRAL